MRWTEDQLAAHLARTGIPGAPNGADTGAPPFALPATEIVIDLPFPPSVNRLWRSSSKDGASMVYLSPSYVKWKKKADLLTFGMARSTIAGPFEAVIGIWPPKGQQRGDIDNRIKAVLDWTQHAGVVKNDKHCQRLTIEWVDQARAPAGCRIALRACA